MNYLSAATRSMQAAVITLSLGLTGSAIFNATTSLKELIGFEPPEWAYHYVLVAILISITLVFYLFEDRDRRRAYTLLDSWPELESHSGYTRRVMPPRYLLPDEEKKLLEATQSYISDALAGFQHPKFEGRIDEIAERYVSFNGWFSKSTPFIKKPDGKPLSLYQNSVGIGGKSLLEALARERLERGYSGGEEEIIKVYTRQSITDLTLAILEIKHQFGPHVSIKEAVELENSIIKHAFGRQRYFIDALSAQAALVRILSERRIPLRSLADKMDFWIPITMTIAAICIYVAFKVDASLVMPSFTR